MKYLITFFAILFTVSINAQLTQITEGSNTGWRLETIPDLDGGAMASIGNKAIDMTIHDDGFWFYAGAEGDYSFVVNKDNYATGAYSSAFGISSYVSGFASISAGADGNVSGSTSFGFGDSLEVSADDATAVGKYNVDDTNAAFMVGNGTGISSRSNALTVLKNGTITAPSLTNALIDTAGDKALITKDYALNVINEYGLHRIDQGDDPPGWILPGGYLDGGFLIGPGIWSVDLILHEELIGQNGGDQGTGVSGNYSFGAGRDNAVIGNYAVSFGGYNQVLGEGSAVFGSGNETTGEYANAFGSGLKVDAFHSLVLGRYNVGGGTTDSWVETDPILEIGNGTFSTRSNVLTVLKNGTTTIAGDLNINSDARLKSNIISLGNTLNKVLSLDGKRYTFKSDESKQKIGLLAQDVQEVFPELVNEASDEQGTLSVNYQALIPVLINAIKEQQKEINELKGQVKNLLKE